MLSHARPLPASLLHQLSLACPAAHCELHAVALDEAALAEQRDGRWLTDADRSRAARFRRAVSAQRWSRVRAALRELLAERVGHARACAPFLTGSAGKPRIGGESGGEVDPVWHFSVSHSHELALIVVATVGETGVDIERIGIDRDHASLLAVVASEAEQQEFDRLERDTLVRERAFMRLWTRKEAVVKASGAGIGFGLTRVEVGVGVQPHLSIDGVVAPRTVLADLSSPPGYCAALCVRLPPGEDEQPTGRQTRPIRPHVWQSPR